MENRLRELRNNAGLNLRKAADKLEVSKSTLASYEKGHSLPKSDFLQRAADYYGVSIDYILKRSDIKYDVNKKSVQKASKL